MNAPKIRRFRRYVSYPLILSALLLASPVSIQTHYLLDKPLDIAGGVIAFFGLTLRLWAWGTNPPGPHLRISGPYAFIRHPLYLGNFLIALGLLMIFNVPIAYLIVLPSLALLYWIVTGEEEMRLEQKWGEAYRHYREKVPRFVPWHGKALTADQDFQFDPKQALGKEGETICGLIAAAISLELYGGFLIHGLRGTQKEILFYGLVPLLALGLLSSSIYLHKKRNHPGKKAKRKRFQGIEAK